MNRTDRLYALVEKLRARAPRTLRAVELAASFEVSIRTIERDLLSLQEAGVPIWSQSGPGGGYGLHADMTLPPLNLTSTEAAALAIALASAHAMPLAEAGQSALQKIVTVMASAPRDAAANLVNHVRVVRDLSSPQGQVFDVIQHAIVEHAAMALTYCDSEGKQTQRTVELGGIISTPHGWYLAAWCRLRQAPRSFRLDRIVEATLTPERISPRMLDTLLVDLPYELAQPVLQQP
jgi:predicted DNA-binding transcriptional regulator YafY